MSYVFVRNFKTSGRLKDVCFESYLIILNLCFVHDL
jgi:hypothetical protein